MKKTIGIVGGVGPFAGLDLFKKIFQLTHASSDQCHLNVLLHSFPDRIPDRTAYLMGEEHENPAKALFEIVQSLTASSANIIGVPCNTSHSDAIWRPLSERIAADCPHVALVNMVDEVAFEIKSDHEEGSRIGVMATTGTVASAAYSEALQSYGMAPVYPDDDIQKDFVQDAIYNREYGIKAFSDPATDKARMQLMTGLDHLLDKGADAIILGCTEIPLSITEESYKTVPLYDSSLILARKLVELAE